MVVKGKKREKVVELRGERKRGVVREEREGEERVRGRYEEEG